MSTPPIVIIAEADPMISSVLRVEFTRLDFAVFLAVSGREAEEYAAHSVAHLVVLDARAQLEACESCARIRRRQGYANRPIVLTTNEPSPRLKAASNKAGATLLLEKPYSVSGLFGAIESFLPPDDLLLTHRALAPGMRAPRTWAPAQSKTWSSGGDSALTRNGRLLPIVRGKGVSIPFIKKP